MQCEGAPQKVMRGEELKTTQEENDEDEETKSRKARRRNKQIQEEKHQETRRGNAVTSCPRAIKKPTVERRREKKNQRFCWQCTQPRKGRYNQQDSKVA